MYRLVLPLTMLLTLGACGPSVDPAAKASIDQWVAGIQVTDASYDDQGLQLATPKVGQWAEYKDIDGDGTVSRRIQKVVGEEAGGYWIETEMETVSGTSLMKVLIALQDWSRPDTMEIRRVISQQPGEQAQEMPAFLANAVAKPVTAAFTSTKDGVNGPIETVTVPAGSFAAHKITNEGINIPLIGDTSGTSWVNTSVPLSAAVKIESNNGYRSELVRFGQTGAKSAITGPVQATF